VFRYDPFVEDYVVDGMFTLKEDADRHYKDLALKCTGTLTHAVKPVQKPFSEVFEQELKARQSTLMWVLEEMARLLDKSHSLAIAQQKQPDIL
jgi:hypothetical protein